MNRTTAAILLSLCGCNQIFGIQRTEVADAAYFDAPADAPFSCPELGEPAPLFSRLVHQLAQDCYDYTISTTDWATAFCHEPSTSIAQGPADQQLEPIPGLAAPAATLHNQPRIAPEGDVLYHRAHVTGSNTADVRILRRGADNSWTLDGKLSPMVSAGAQIGAPTRDLPGRRMMVSAATGGIDIREIAITANGAWTTVDTYTLDQLNVDYVTSGPNLTPDGLRMVYAGGHPTTGRVRAFYSMRARLEDRFTTISPLELLSVGDVFMTEDCGRLYFSAASSILYVQRK